MGNMERLCHLSPSRRNPVGVAGRRASVMDGRGANPYNAGGPDTLTMPFDSAI